MLVDLHMHLLPGLDDGPQTDADAVGVVRAAALGGTSIVVATPHVRGDHPRVRIAELPARLEALRALVRAEGVDIEIAGGAEVDVTRATELSDEDLRAATYRYAGRDILVETPFTPITPLFRSVLDDLRGRGLRVLLAHPERNVTFQAQPERLAALVAEGGVLAQLTVTSLTSRSAAGHAARAMLRAGAAHVLASDAHGVDWRPPSLKASTEEAAEALPEYREELMWMASAAPAAILAGEPLPERPATGPGRVGRVPRILRRGR